MSAAFKNSKRKQTQSELRKFMNEHRGKAQKDVKKIDSPLAKYNDQGQLTCILCKSVVRSEAVWTVHINAKQHRENVELAKKLKERTNNFTTPLKRPLTPPMEVPQKKPKSILKNSNNKQVANEDTPNGTIPQDFFDSNKKETFENSLVTHEKMEIAESIPEEGDVLPEGFFDDPKLDAKARHQEYKDPIEEEWEKFQKEIKEADNQSAAIIAEDQEESTTERQIDEIDEQMKNLSKVLDLEKKKSDVITVSNAAQRMEIEETSDEGEADFDEYLDWRSKKSFK